MALARSTCERFSGRGDQRGAERAAAGQGGVGRVYLGAGDGEGRGRGPGGGGGGGPRGAGGGGLRGGRARRA